MPNPYVQLATAISRLAESIFVTRESAYNRKLDKLQEKAIAEGEKAVELLGDVFSYLFFKKILPYDKRFKEYKKLYIKIKTRFNKYD